MYVSALSSRCPDIWVNFSLHTCYFLRGGQQLKIYTEEEGKKSQALISGITFSVKSYWFALGNTQDVSLGALGRTRRKK